MKITRLFCEKQNGFNNHKNPTIVFFGDSVTQGCFDCYINENEEIDTYFEQKYAYHRHLSEILAVMYPRVPVNIINAGISGDKAVSAYGRLERDVLSCNPDLVVVCFGLNDCQCGIEGIEKYYTALKNIFIALKENGSEIIFMTPNMMNTKISCHIKDNTLIETAMKCMELQNGGVLDAYLEKARQAAAECGVRLCDVYEKWKLMAENGVDTTELLANRINHPIHMMNWIFAYSLIEEMMK